jgi:hypothetical protein
VAYRAKFRDQPRGWPYTALCAVYASNFLVRNQVVLFLGNGLGPELEALRNKLLAVLNRANGSHVPVQQVDLFQGESLRLRDAEICEDDAAETGRAPDVEYLGAKVCISGPRVDHVRCCEIRPRCVTKTPIEEEKERNALA